MDLVNQRPSPLRSPKKRVIPLILYRTSPLICFTPEGRLQQATLDLLAGSDIQFRRETRLDIALVKNHPIALVFLPAADIPTFVGEGRVDLGITGRDQVAEHEAFVLPTDDTGVEEVLNLGFGRCRLQVQVPEKGTLGRPEELVGKNVVTSFVGLTEKYFARLEGLDGAESGVGHGDTLVRNRLKTKIKYVGGSVEAACALGVADGIVDLVGKSIFRVFIGGMNADSYLESGETMKAAGLKAIDTVVESTATLIKSKHPSNQRLVDMIASRISGVITAQKFILCQYNVARKGLETATKITPGKRAPTITALEDPAWVAVSSMVLKENIATVMDELTACGATDILVLNIANSRTG